MPHQFDKVNFLTFVDFTKYSLGCSWYCWLFIISTRSTELVIDNLSPTTSITISETTLNGYWTLFSLATWIFFPTLTSKQNIITDYLIKAKYAIVNKFSSRLINFFKSFLYKSRYFISSSESQLTKNYIVRSDKNTAEILFISIFGD